MFSCIAANVLPECRKVPVAIGIPQLGGVPAVQRTPWEEPFGITYFSLRRVVRVKIESQKLAVYSFAGIGAMQ